MPWFPYADSRTGYENLTLEAQKGTQRGGHDAQHIPEQGDRHTVIPLLQHRSDMQLAEGIKTKNNTIRMPAGFTLTEIRINRMWQLEDDLEKPAPKLWMVGRSIK